MLDLHGLHTGYGDTRILHGLDLAVAAGRVHAILGRNGVGKTTALKAIMGLLPVLAGTVTLDGTAIAGETPARIARRGIAYVPETRDIFGALTVMENLALAARLRPTAGDWTIDRVLAFFPKLANRRRHGGNQLSGGEQQMLAIGRALVMNPRLLVLDEPTEGLAPIVIRQIFDKLAALKQSGLTILLVEQNISVAGSLADEISLIGRGTRVWHGTPAALQADTALQADWLGV